MTEERKFEEKEVKTVGPLPDVKLRRGNFDVALWRKRARGGEGKAFYAGELTVSRKDEKTGAFARVRVSLSQFQLADLGLLALEADRRVREKLSDYE